MPRAKNPAPAPVVPDAPASLLSTLGAVRAPKSARVFVLAQYPDAYTGADGAQHPHPDAGAVIMERTPTDDGRLASVECEIRADGTSGAPMYALTRVSDDGRESTVRASFADLSAFAVAATRAGLDLA